MSTSVSPTRGQAVRRSRSIVIFVLVIVAIVAVSVVLLYANRINMNPLSTRSAQPDGTRALAQLLEDQGVDVTESTSPRQARDEVTADSTLVVADTTFLTEKAARSIADDEGDVVLIEPLPTRLDDLMPGVRTGERSDATTIAPRCSLPAAQRAGSTEMGGATAYRTADGVDATSCYRTEEGAHLVRTSEDGRTVTAVSSSFPFTNGGLDRKGNAALTLNLLGGNEDLVWLMPDPEAAEGQATGSLTGLMPDPARVAAFGVILAVVVFAVAKGRRIGPVVAERLPVVVRAAETTQGRARLYRSLRARERAADALRHGARESLRPSLQLPRTASAEAVVAAVARRIGWDPAEVSRLLYGGPPADDAELVRLADELDALEGEVRRS